MDVDKVADALFMQVKDYVERALQPVHERLKEFESIVPIPGPAGEKGDPGTDGTSVTLDDVLPVIEEAVKQLPLPENGKDGEDATDEQVQLAVTAYLEANPLPVPKDGETGPPGENGKDGTSVAAEDVLPELTEQLQKAIEAISVPKDGEPGRDGIDGKDGESVTVDDLRPMVEGAQATWALGWERHAQASLQAAFDRMPKAKDGKDGLGFDDLELIHDGERTFTFKFERGEQLKEFAFKVPAVIERGIYRSGTVYEKGDGVTFGGSYWIAQKDTEAKPGTDDSWRLAIKKGRDGRDGEKGPKGEQGPRGKS